MTGDQVTRWKAAIAASKRKQRQQRGRRQKSAEGADYRPGMARIRPPAQMMVPMASLPKCTHRGCPIRWHDGDDRPCADHTDHDTLTARLAEMGALPAEFAAAGDSDGDLQASTEGRRAEGRHP
jgi:hypothetical protein